ncbi:MAG: hypothetical protein U0441_26155 [Polyangiaceae bacterium]
MIEFFKDGGWGMWPILFMGLATLVSAGLYAYRPEARKLGFIIAVGIATLFATAGATITDVGTVCWAIANREFPNEERPLVFLQGMRESTRPGVFGTTILCVAALLVAAGQSRRPRENEA